MINVRSATHYGLNPDIEQGPKCANCRHKSSSCPSNHRTRPSEQSHRELGAIAKFAVDRDGAAVLLRYDFVAVLLRYDFVADRQPKPRALAGRLQSILFFRRDADAIVPHTRTSTPSPDSRVVIFKAARNNRAYEFSSGDLAEQAPRGKKINSFKAFGEPVVNPFQQLDGLPLAALIGP